MHQHLPRTKYDIVMDQASNKPGEQAFEKVKWWQTPRVESVSHFSQMISGRYLGEIFRLVICELIDEGALFLGQNTYKLENIDAVETAFLSLMES
jgi:hexokinase